MCTEREKYLASVMKPAYSSFGNNKGIVPKAPTCNTGLPRAALDEKRITVGLAFGRQSEDGVRRCTRRSQYPECIVSLVCFKNRWVNMRALTGPSCGKLENVTAGSAGPIRSKVRARVGLKGNDWVRVTAASVPRQCAAVRSNGTAVHGNGAAMRGNGASVIRVILGQLLATVEVPLIDHRNSKKVKSLQITNSADERRDIICDVQCY
ncbi:hypothetical protein B0H19DRAFT_1063063 [Mycena capillaripes]|nr:hypothetical protein B0H19DRAFT_1063063 [Mycena capillaripes]